jgi:membrane-bound metal-dependent hydrolase YbcI (DUF457 family)
MTPIGHTLTGLAIGYLVVPRDTPPKQKAITLGVFAILASAPDLPFPYWGHNDYRISHSLVMTTLGIVLIGGFFAIKYRGRPPFTPTMLIAGAIAWYSHILLDTMYNHAIGLEVGWPLFDYRLRLPVSWQSPGNKHAIFSMHNVKVAVYEILTFGPLLMLSILAKKYLLPLRQSSKTVVSQTY